MPIRFVGTSTTDFASSTANRQIGNYWSGATLERLGFTNSSRATTPVFGAMLDGWYSFEHSLFVGDGSNPYLAFICTSSGNNVLFRLTRTAAGVITPQLWNGTAYVNLTTFTPATISNSGRMDIHFVSDPVDGLIEIYIAGILAWSFSGQTDYGIGDPDYFIIQGTTTGVNATNAGRVIVADEDTRPLEFFQRIPTAIGARTDWTGLISALNTATLDDTTYFTSDAAGEKETFDIGAMPAGLLTRSVEAVVIAGRYRRGDSSDKVTGIVHIGVSDFELTDFFTYTAVGGFADQHWYSFVNPSTGNTWIASEIDAAEFGVLSK